MTVRFEFMWNQVKKADMISLKIVQQIIFMENLIFNEKDLFLLWIIK